MATAMDRSVEQRRIARGLFTKCANKFDTSLADENRTRVTVSASYENLKSKFEELNKLDNTILNHWLDLPERSEEAYETHIATSEDYIERWHLLQQKYNQFIKEQEEEAHTLLDSKAGSASSTSSKERINRLFKLPKLELPKFDGDIRKWLYFWGMFEKIHEDNDLEADVKFQYLSQCMETGSPAQKMIESYPPTAANYEKAVEQLKARFGREELLIEIYVRELLSIVLEQSKCGGKISLATLYDRLKTQLHALESLGVTSDKYAAMIRPLVESALPIELLRVWKRQDSKTTHTHQDQSSTLNDLLIFLKRETESEETTKTRKYITENEPSTSSFPTATGVKIMTQKVEESILCDELFEKDVSSECEGLEKMGNEECTKTVKSKNICENVNGLSLNMSLEAGQNTIKTIPQMRKESTRMIYCDGTNSKRAEAANITKEMTLLDKAKRHFIPPKAPPWGGYWEHSIKMVQDQVALHILCEIEGVLNNRSLVSNANTDNLVPLKPDNFLVPNKRHDTRERSDKDKTQASQPRVSTAALVCLRAVGR